MKNINLLLLLMILSTLKIAFSPLLLILESLFSDGEESFISKEGYEYLNDPIKKQKLNNYVDNWKLTGVWNPDLLK